MGGYGSGRRGSRHIVEQCMALDIGELNRKKLLHPGVLFSWSWFTSGTLFEEPQKSGEVKICGGTNSLDLSYNIDGQNYLYPVFLAWTECNYGQKRPWFLCPGCGCPVAKIYLPPGGRHFRCRKCYALTYYSSNESRNSIARAWRKVRRLQRLLGIGDNEYPVCKPKGMHYRTYHRLLLEYQKAIRERERAFLGKVEALNQVK